jgi:hypothetical protein
VALHRASAESLATVEIATAVRLTQSLSRSTVEVLTTSETLARLLASYRDTHELLSTGEIAVTGPVFSRTTSEFLFINENVTALVLVGGEWNYLLPFPTGNSAVVSDLRYVLA